ncbi:PTS sugar transporter subunit IIB [Lederbergia sp. NSJ-179]|uniref:PTS sugar transporter subunit IIB n=1 Tax=Lederbergia sp. NSJ-179 TaxID=2931402 RepID=UPI001FD47284|nr:PTS sugar transporter subunit IIB [Lederbergia sp. NSJ-179]MCJ7843250.1 PTS sugar transporter subunit IIB [Lederbergia sp. NSJ-179]
MIKLLRVDHRLLHGQVAVSWARNLGIDCLLIANDDVPNDELRKSMIKMAKPQGIKLVIKNIEDSIQAINNGKTDKYKLFIVVESVEDAYRLATGAKGIEQINLGNLKKTEETRSFSKLVNITEHDEEMLKELVRKGVEVEARAVPGDKRVKIESLLK